MSTSSAVRIGTVLIVTVLIGNADAVDGPVAVFNVQSVHEFAPLDT